MKKTFLLTISSLLLIGGVITSCQKEDSAFTKNDVKTLTLKNGAGDCTNCIDPANPVYYPMVSTICDGPENPDKCTTVKVYNTLTNLVVEVSNTEQTGTFWINDVEMPQNGFAAGVVATNTFPLPQGWQACDPYPLVVRIVGGGTPDLHELTYYLVGACSQECNPQSETAWSAGKRFVSKGNWATYTTYSANLVQTIYAGQTINVGTATFSPVSGGNVTITVNLTGGWYFKSVSENLKVQGYSSTPPAVNPSPGLFADKITAAGTTASIVVPAALYYGVHLDVEICQ